MRFCFLIIVHVCLGSSATLLHAFVTTGPWLSVAPTWDIDTSLMTEENKTNFPWNAHAYNF